MDAFGMGMKTVGIILLLRQEPDGGWIRLIIPKNWTLKILYYSGSVVGMYSHFGNVN
jgi:hypothetical protein